MTKELKDKAISIKGKEYVLVKDRVLAFNEVYKNGCIITERLSEWDREIFKATVIPDCANPERKFTWYSQAKWAEDKGKMDINITAAMENAETSAVGRALAMMGIWVIDSIASADEMRKAGADWLKRMSDADYAKLEANKGRYNTADDLVKAAKTKYVVDQVLEAKIRSLYD